MRVQTSTEVSQRILNAARDLFFTRGFSGTSLRAIARAAGTSESGILRIYGSKNGVLRAVYGSCWEEINTRVEEALAAASEEDPDPRNLLEQLMRTVFCNYQEKPAMMAFLLSHFCYSETCGLVPLDDSAPVLCERAAREYHRYLDRIFDLCAAVTRTEPGLGRLGITPAGLSFVVISLIHGVQTGWYVTSLEKRGTLPDITSDEIIAAAQLLLCQEPLAEPRITGDARSDSAVTIEQTRGPSSWGQVH